MPLFVVTCTDNEGTVEKRLAVRPQHLARLEKLDAEGRLIAAGAMPKDPGNPQAGFYGSTIIADFDSREALDAWLQEEPFLKEGVYGQIDVKPFNKAFPKG
ncbi:YciI family protein [Acinetobacter sp.]|uniref:YciI family protein n=1 Tax=Acinetobacter sp. TaxID=472 RepID=UPI0035B026E1